MATAWKSLIDWPNGVAVLDGDIDDSTETIVLATGDGAKFPAGVPFSVLIGQEQVNVASRSGDTFTCTSGRGANGTTAVVHSSGDTVEVCVFAQHFNDIQDAVNSLEDGTTTVDSLTTSGDAVVGGDLQVNGQNIGIAADTDLLTLAANLLTVAGAILASGNLKVDGGDIGTTADSDTIGLGAGTVAVRGALTVQDDAVLGSELIVNGDMELDANWTGYGSPTTRERSSEQAHGGTYSRKIVTDAVGEGEHQALPMRTSIGARYLISAWVYGANGVTGQLRLRDSAFTWNQFTAFTCNGAWQQITLTATTTTVTQPLVQIVGVTTAAQTFYYDDVSCKRVGGDIAVRGDAYLAQALQVGKLFTLAGRGTFTANDTTPSVAGANNWVVPATWTAGNNITTFDDGVAGTTYLIIGGDSDCVVVDGSNLKLNGNWTAAAYATLLLYFDGTNYLELTRCAP